MKQVYSNKYFDWILIAITLLYSFDSILNLFRGYEFLNSYLLRIVFALVSIIAFVSLFVKNLNGERYTRFFIIVTFIIPSLVIINTFLTDLIYYGVNRLDSIQTPILFLMLVIGIILFVLSIKFSIQTKSDQIKDYGILISYIGVFVIMLILIRAIEPIFITDLNNISIWKIIPKSIIGLLIIYFGYQLKNEKIKLKSSIIFTLVLMFIYGSI